MLKVLYVEDDKRSREVMRMIEESTPGFMSVTVFEDSLDFEAKLLNTQPQPDIVLLDIHVKPYNGFQMLSLIRVHSEYNAVPVLALTASVMNEEIRMLQDAGFDGVFSKPVDIDNFPFQLNRVLQGEKLWNIL